MTERRVFWTFLPERNINCLAVQALVRIAGRCSRAGFNYISLPYLRTDDARNTACLALAKGIVNDRDTLVMLDADHEHPPDIVERLVKHDVGVVGALYFRRSEPYDAMVFIRGEDDVLHTPAEWDEDAGLQPCACVGTGAIAIQAGVFKALMAAGFNWPWFRYGYHEDSRTQPTEDMYFGHICEQAGISHHVDFSLTTPHLAMSRIDRAAFEAHRNDPQRAVQIDLVDEYEMLERYPWMAKWQFIDGWLTHEEAAHLHDTARSVTGDWIVELGTWSGRSTVALGMGVKASRCRVVSYDRYEGVPEIDRTPTLAEAQSTIDAFDLPLTVQLVEGDSTWSAGTWPIERRVSLLFIDAGHEADEVYNDARAWLPHCAPGALVLFHDYAYGWPGVMAAVQRLQAEGRIKMTRQVGSIACCIKTEVETCFDTLAMETGCQGCQPAT